ncbi:MAG: amino acid adenylation domain-containing protein, partial [Burkholderiales bacterium]
PVANRQEAQLEDLIGFFVNTLVMRVKVNARRSFAELLGEVKRVALEAYEQQDVPFERVVEELAPRRSLNTTPVFQVAFALHNAPRAAEPAEGLTVEMISEEQPRVRYDLEVNARDDGEELEISWLYNRDLFDRGRMERMARGFRVMLETLAADAGRPLSQLSLLGEDERRLLLESWNDTRREFKEATLPELFEEQARRTPGATAVVYEGWHLTYEELNERANRLAHLLSAEGVGPGDVVGLAVPRSAEMVVSLLGIMKAGAAYLPIDPEYPAERVAFVLDDARPACVLTTVAAASRLPEGHRRLLLDEAELTESLGRQTTADPAGLSSPASLAYLIYTSGSTGRPKGVGVSHRACVNLLSSIGSDVEFRPDDVLLAITSLSFDIAVLELYLPLLSGATTVVASREDALDGRRLADVLRRSGATVMQATPSTWRMLFDSGWGGSHGLKMISGGEALPSDLAAQMLERPGSVYNLYGPTETTVWSTWARVDAAEHSTRIGRPVANTQCHLLDSSLNLVPIGATGELYIAGAGLAYGYLNRTDLTAAAFVPNPFSKEPGARMYRTGDLARRAADGALEYLGRSDQQLKVRGHRVEPGEVESALRSLEGVAEAAVVAREDAGGERRLVGYVVASGERGIDTAALRRQLLERLPGYMVPQALVEIGELPLTPNGKVDRKALPEAEWVSARKYRGPRTPEEEALCGLFAEALGVRQVGIDDDFFELGGHSLLATRLVSRVRAVLGVELAIRTLFESPTVGGLSERLLAADKGRAPLVRQERPARLPLSYAQQRLWFIDRLGGTSTEYNMPAAWLLRGELDRAALERAVNAVVERHESLRTRFVEMDGEPAQVIEPAGWTEVPLEDLSGLDEAARRARLTAVLSEEAARPFDLERGPLLRVRLLKLAESEHVLLRNVHHIVSDGWSEDVFGSDFATIYEAFREGRENPLKPLGVQYADFALWQRGWMEGARMRAGLDYWTRRLAGAPARLELPTDRPRHAVQTFDAEVCRVTLSPEQSEALRRLGREHHATLYMTLLAALSVLLSRHAGQDDIVIGSPVANRQEAQLEDLIGFFVNTLVMRVRVRPGRSFAELLGEVKRVALEAYEQQDVPFERVVEELAPRRSLNTTPVFQVAFAFQNAPKEAAPAGGLEVEPLDSGELRVRYDLEMHAWDEAGRIGMSWFYNRDLFDRGRMERMARQYLHVLEEAAAEPAREVGQIELLSEEERGRILDDWNETAREVPATTLAEMFEQQAAETPAAPALVYGAQELSYAELNGRANQLARQLRRMGVGPEVPVGLLLERSTDMVVSLLAVLKAGGAYVPLDPEYPRGRLSFMLEDAGAPVVLTQQHLLELAGESKAGVFCIDAGREEVARQSAANLEGGSGPENLAYVIYTSGSTGRP